MAFETTLISKIYNFATERVVVRQLQQGLQVQLDPGDHRTVGWPVPWVNSPGDMGGSAPRLIHVGLQATDRYVLIWQHDQMIISGLSYTQFSTLGPDMLVGGQKDLVIRHTHIELHTAGQAHFQVKPAAAAEQAEMFGSGQGGF